MDRPLERKRFTPARIAVLCRRGARRSRRNDPDRHSLGRDARCASSPTRLTTAVVAQGEFREYYPFDGRVEPSTTVYLDVEEGGRVEEIFVAGGHAIEKGDLILRLSNANLQRTAIETETRLIENLDLLRNTEFNRAQEQPAAEGRAARSRAPDRRGRDALQALTSRSTRRHHLAGEVDETTRDELAYLRGKRELLQQRIAQEDILAPQPARAGEGVHRAAHASMELLAASSRASKCARRSPGSCRPSTPQVGQNIKPGQRIGQIDQLDAFKDARAHRPVLSWRAWRSARPASSSSTASVRRGGEEDLPGSVNDAFAADIVFVGAGAARPAARPALTVELSFGASTQS